jgi:hypothetical protein
MWLRRAVLAVAVALPALAAAQTADKPFSKEQIDQLTAQVALFPDALLSQVLMAATYPTDVAEAAKWSRANSEQKGDDAVRMVDDQPWDPSVKSLVAFPQVVIMMGENPGWVKDLGDAFLAQPEDVMDSIQRLRAAAQKAGNLQSNNDVVVRVEAAPPPTIVIEASAPPPPPQVIVIEQRNPQVVFVPVYNPIYVFGPWLWPAWPPVFIPPPPGFWFSTAVVTGVVWGVGIGVRHAIWGSPNWWGRSVNINVNHWNNINVNNRININTNDKRWSHNVNNRRDVPYRGGDRTRQQLQDRAQRVDRDAYRGRDLDRQRAQAALQNRGISTDRAELRDVNRDQLRQQAQQFDRSGRPDRAQGIDRGPIQDRARDVDRAQLQDRARDVDRGQLQNRAQSVDRAQLQDRARDVDRSQLQNRARDVDRSQIQNRPKNPAFQGVNDRQARDEINRGIASRQSAQQYQRPQAGRPYGGSGGAARPQGASRPYGGSGGGASRPQAGRPSGGGGGASRPQVQRGGAGAGGRQR